MSVTLVSTLVVALATLAWALISWSQRKRGTQLDIPYVDVEGDKSPMRYVRETGDLIAKGYKQFSKKGLPFSIVNLSDPSSPLILLPIKYVDEVAHAPQNKLSLQEYFSKLGLLKYNYGPPIAEEVQRVAKTDLNRALNDLTQPFLSACQSGFEKNMPKCQDWTPLTPYNIFMRIIVRMGARMLVGPDLQDAWTELSLEYLPAFSNASRRVRTEYNALTRWTAPYIDSEIKAVLKHRRKGADMLRSAQQARPAEHGAENKTGRQHQDALQWLMNDHKANGHTPSPDELAQGLFVMTISSTHQTTMITLWLLFDLIDHPESLSEIRDEIKQVQTRHPVWTRRALGELKIMDSFMTETMRVHSFAQTTVNRMVLKPYTFKDGFHLPAGTQLSFPTEQYSLDPDLHPNPDIFDPKRQLQKQEQIDPAKYHFASTADSLAWGSGPHACPGRFMVQDVIKLMFIHLLTQYEFKYPEDGKTRPSPDTPIGMMKGPDLTMMIVFKEKSA